MVDLSGFNTPSGFRWEDSLGREGVRPDTSVEARGSCLYSVLREIRELI